MGGGRRDGVEEDGEKRAGSLSGSGGMIMLDGRDYVGERGIFIGRDASSRELPLLVIRCGAELRERIQQPGKSGLRVMRAM